ncbi:pyrroline-5-carboxylate reductase [Haematospirillum jordaniae]|uniref:pyrroline-5-carboxylate reductase n=1 Tax=Haematospirillum jordaniae TaxID=1549855 RepID=UPI000A6CE0D1|nr:pyrroline-5-carboxylate reductase [Haematospirillum jordaniae]NKD44861.1 pyrroline-5-carboxylate reductase [Haematospirillum jordaniae]NKD57052.1 pyrroline-5-carboxylate reductase [Haematospirillum jordaniae]NKD58792.1 pyrroline-5-carboxylate reductase [Haematospirillum jordaniae]NKD66977.1 pyrroline-5-carboxylate reductase [Haematospirillum jordaniae]NKD78794.1 pyrroline-5-carboxylate reductase [Haematospirillum jordaniae]
MLSPLKPVVLFGCGNMGRAMLSGWLRNGFDPGHILVIARRGHADLPEGTQHPALRVVQNVGDLPRTLKASAVVFAVKPRALAGVMGSCRFLVNPETVFLSVAAGISLKTLQDGLGSQARSVRAMPNTPTAVGRGVTALCAGPGVGEEQKKLCHTLGESTGLAVWLDDEHLMDAVTALSGSGPAYVFHMTEALTKAGEALGLPPGLATALARHTVCGSGELMYQSADTAEQLRQYVTSPGGTTEAGLSVLMPELTALMTRTLQAAAERSAYLGTKESHTDAINNSHNAGQ